MNDVARLIGILAVLSVSLAAFCVVVAALFPHRVTRTHTLAGSMPGRAFLVGLVNFLFFAALALGFMALGEWSRVELFNLPALLFAGILGVGLSFGLAGVVRLVGARLVPEPLGVRQTVWGALALGWACGLPFLGWFGLLPYTGLLGLGAFIISLFYRESPVEATGG
jgi:hypothetical protein